MRTELEGKAYVEQYVHTLTHELKSPLAAIRGAAELLESEMPAEQRQRFVANIASEGARLQQLIERLLNLALVEQRQGLEERVPVALHELVESLIDDIPGVLESAVIGLSHPDLGEGVTAVVVPQKGASLDERAVIAAIGGKLARYKQPKRVIFVDELPRNVMGKVQKAELRKTYADLYR